ncbi:MAG TPA: GGDEF domain-containing protein [Aquificaceae bacterium]|nr:GGDEF domain-containing protein [Aquificaceae bacterium]
MGVDELGKFLPVVLISRNYIITSLNDTAKTMLGDVVGKRCYQVLYNLSKPCTEHGIKCPVSSGEEDIDTVTLDFEVYLRAYGKLPVGGIYWESVVNITNLSVIRSGVFDALTGLHSRNFSLEMIEKFLRMRERYGESFSLMLIDIRGLGKINEEYGTLSGDEALRKVAQCIRLYLRKADIGTRYEGGKFLVVLPKTKKEEASGVAGRICECVKSIPFVRKLSVSIGVVESSKEGEEAMDLIERAERALSLAKRRGSAVETA